MFWKVSSFPKTEKHIFLSHSAEDRPGLVRPIYDALKERGVLPFIDVEDYYHGRETFDALRGAILRSRHIAFFITDAMLGNSRGWCAAELAYAELLDLNFSTTGGKLLNGSLPLFLVPQSDPRIERSVWQLVRNRGRFHDADSDRVAWCVREILQFLDRESQLAKGMATDCRLDNELSARIKQTPGLLERVTKFQPRLPKLPAIPSPADPLA